MVRQNEGVPTIKFIALLSTWYLVTLFSNMSGKAFVKQTLDAISPSTVSLGCAAVVYGAHRLFYRNEDLSKSLLPRDLSSSSLELHKWAIVVGFVQFLATAMTYASFALSSVAWTYCFRTLEPLISAAVQYLAFHKHLTFKELSALSILAAGIIITVNSGNSAQTYSPWIGGLALTATAIYSTRSVCGSHVMTTYNVSGRELFLLASVYGLGFSLWMQATVFVLQQTVSHSWTWKLVRDLAFSGVFHCIYNLMSFQILELLQPVAHGVCNTMKRVFMVLVAAALSGQWLTYLQVFGVLVANSSAALYSIEVKKRKAAKVQEALETTPGPGYSVEEFSSEKRVEKKLIVWNASILIFGFMYLGMALSALSAWKTTMSANAGQVWSAQEFFDSLLHVRKAYSTPLNQTSLSAS